MKIQDQISQMFLTAPEGKQTFQHGRAHFTICVPGVQKYREQYAKWVKRPTRHQTPPPFRSDISKALELYGSEVEAAKRIREHLAIQGGDGDPAVTKRAARFASTMEQGHPIWKKGNTFATTSEVLANALTLSKRFNERQYTLTAEHVETLKQRGYNLVAV